MAGELSNVDRVLIDVGTGYYVEKPVEDAKKYYADKEAFLNGQLQELSKTINAKRENLQGMNRARRSALLLTAPLQCCPKSCRQRCSRSSISRCRRVRQVQLRHRPRNEPFKMHAPIFKVCVSDKEFY